MPTTMCCGRPQNFCSAQTMASSGLVMQMTKAFGRIFLDAGADLLHHLEVDAEQVVAAHAGLARHAGGDDADIGAGDRLVVVGAREAGIEAARPARIRRGRAPCPAACLRRCRTCTTSPSSLRPIEVGERAADLAGADQCDLLTRHDGKSLKLGSERRGDAGRWWVNPSGALRQGVAGENTKSGAVYT